MGIKKEDFKNRLQIGDKTLQYYDLYKLANTLQIDLDRLPFTIKILLEQLLRNLDGKSVRDVDLEHLSDWGKPKTFELDIPFKPARVVLQDFTGVPALVDLASLRSAMVKLNQDPERINPVIPVDLIVDHSIQVDFFGTAQSLAQNMELEFKRNRERYEFLKWGQKAFQNLRIFPPGIGIIHQVNLEFLASAVLEKDGICYPDTLVGTDSHTTMINGLGVLGWGVGGIEAESAILGQPIYMRIPQVVGFELSGKIPTGSTATDLVLRIVEILREKGVVEKFVEFYGSGLSVLSLADRATIANMAPEYGATMGFFPVDQETLNYLKSTGRPQAVIRRVEIYCRAQGMFRTDQTITPEFTDKVHLDLSTVVPSLAGPKRPQDRIPLSESKSKWNQMLTAPISPQGFNLSKELAHQEVDVNADPPYSIKNGSVVLAAITSCANTSNPSVMITAGLVARNALKMGLRTKPWVKTSLAPGSRVVSDYLEKSKLTESLKGLGFYTVGYGCTTCIGNSGPLPPHIEKAIRKKDLVVASVLSGNRNFEGRINPHVKANFLASPPLVIAYALVGSIDIDFETEPLGTTADGKDVFLKDLWPDKEAVSIIEKEITPKMYQDRYQNINSASPTWLAIKADDQHVFEWDQDSTYIRNPPFFEGISADTRSICDIRNASILVVLGHSVTTDHISPAGMIAPDSPAAKYLEAHQITPKDFNSYGSRRGNDQVMIRGTFANIRLQNFMTPEKEGGYTRYLPTNEQMSIFEAAQRYHQDQTPLVIFAGKEYGTGSSRDWAAKGTYLLGVKAVIAESFERIHRSNLVGMSVLPLQLTKDQSIETLNLKGSESVSILGLSDVIQPGQTVTLRIDDKEFEVICRLDTPIEVEYYKNGGILHYFLRNLIKNSRTRSQA